MGNLSGRISGWLDQDVIDKTGIAGMFEMHLELSATDVNTGGLAGTDGIAEFGAISNAVRKLGLKLESAKVPGEFLVIDHVERPSGN